MELVWEAGVEGGAGGQEEGEEFLELKSLDTLPECCDGNFRRRGGGEEESSVGVFFSSS